MKFFPIYLYSDGRLLRLGGNLLRLIVGNVAVTIAVAIASTVAVAVVHIVACSIIFVSILLQAVPLPILLKKIIASSKTAIVTSIIVLHHVCDSITCFHHIRDYCLRVELFTLTNKLDCPAVMFYTILNNFVTN